MSHPQSARSIKCKSHTSKLFNDLHKKIVFRFLTSPANSVQAIHDRPISSASSSLPLPRLRSIESCPETISLLCCPLRGRSQVDQFMFYLQFADSFLEAAYFLPRIGFVALLVPQFVLEAVIVSQDLGDHSQVHLELVLLLAALANQPTHSMMIQMTSADSPT